jgi:hypothetical protein
MKLVTYTNGSEKSHGALVGEHVLDLSGLGLPDNMLAFIQSGEKLGRKAVRHIQSGILPGYRLTAHPPDGPTSEPA